MSSTLSGLSQATKIINSRIIHRMTRISPTRILLSALLLTSSSAAIAHDTTVKMYRNSNSGLITWSAKDHGFSVELIQLVPDFVRAIYSKHGFPKAEVENIAGYCVFGTIIKNTSGKTLTYRVADWRSVDSSGSLSPIKTKTQWLAQWQQAGVNFSWTLLPDSGTFYAGDWQQGFTTVKLPHDSEFDLIFKWQIEGAEHVGKIKNLRCAAGE